MLVKDPKKRKTIQEVKDHEWVKEGDWPSSQEDCDQANMDLLEFQHLDFLKKATQTFQMINKVNSRAKKLNELDRAAKIKSRKAEHRDRMQKQRTRAQTHFTERRSAEGGIRSQTDGDLSAASKTPKRQGLEKTPK